jgi:hypothetical protein
MDGRDSARGSVASEDCRIAHADSPGDSHLPGALSEQESQEIGFDVEAVHDLRPTRPTPRGGSGEQPRQIEAAADAEVRSIDSDRRELLAEVATTVQLKDGDLVSALV